MSARHRVPTIAIPLATALATLIAPVPAFARDYGQQGAVFPIAEPDLLAVIKARLMKLRDSGAIEAANRQLAARTVARVRRPVPVAGIERAREARTWLIDPTITVAEDLRDTRGRVVVAKGARVNPLDTVKLRQRLIFIDGDAAGQVAWAMASAQPADARVILVRGAPLDLMKTRQRRFYFDQGGVLTKRLGIRAVPVVVEQRGRLLAAREIVMPDTGAASGPAMETMTRAETPKAVGPAGGGLR